MAFERLQKILAQAGVASRRRAEELIVAGRVAVDGEIVRELGSRADPATNRIEVDGRRIVAEERVYLAFHKPRNVVSTMSDPEGRPTVAEYLRRVGARVVPVGRLDFHTSGTLLLTNDGDFAAGLLHPRKSSPKVYVAKVAGILSEEDLAKWREPIVVDGRPTRPAEVRLLRVEGDKTWLEIVLREGKNRQIHRIGEAAGFTVMRLARTSFAGITSEGLRPGEWRHLSVDELTALRRAYGVPKRVHSPPALARRVVRGGAPRPGAFSARAKERPRAKPGDPAPRRFDRPETAAKTSRTRSSPPHAHERRRAPAGRRPAPKPNRK